MISNAYFLAPSLSSLFQPVLATSEVIPSRAMRALEGEGRGLSHLEVIARGAGCGASVRVWDPVRPPGLNSSVKSLQYAAK